jgi:Asp-tRNA(Asn)/Glu-tRNA(Gln) amidotransferase C subunit
MSKKEKLKKIAEMLKFALSTEDDDIIRSTIESVIEMIDEIVN